LAPSPLPKLEMLEEFVIDSRYTSDEPPSKFTLPPTSVTPKPPTRLKRFEEYDEFPGNKDDPDLIKITPSRKNSLLVDLK
jgi:hypothetical protein